MSVIYIQSGFFPFLLFSVLLVAASAAFKIMMETRLKLEKSVIELKILNRVGRTMSSTMDMNRQFERMYLECRKILEFDNFFIAIFEPEKRVFELNYLREKGHLSTGEIISLGEGYTSIVWETKQPIILNHWDDKQFYNVKIPENDRFQEKATSMIFVPMIFKDEVIGVLSIQHAEPNKYTVEDMTILATLANQAAISLSNARLYHTAITEPLTQLHSRNYFFSRFDEELKKCHASKQPLHLLVMDIDEFKMMNDKQGHLVGDEILRSTARVIESNIPGQAIPARYGGDEFMVLLPGTDRDTAFHIAETLRELIHNNPIQYNSLEFSVTVSIGLAGVNGNEIVEKEKIVIDADKGLYEAKTKGKNQVVVYSV